MLLHDVIFRAITLRGGHPVPGAEVFVQANFNAPKQPKGRTDANGFLRLQLEEGAWIFSVPTPPPLHNPTRNLIPPRSRGVLIPSPRRIDILVNTLDADADCYATARRLKKLLWEGQYEKAQVLIDKVTSSYADYQSITQLRPFAQLETALHQIKAGQALDIALDQILIERSFWRKIV